MRVARDLASLLYRRPIHLFTRLNANVQFSGFVRTLGGIPRFPGRRTMYEWINRDWLHGTAVDYLEFGVFRGESLRLWCRLNQNVGSRFYGFDSFEGLPEDWNAEKPAGTFRTDIPAIDDERCQLVKGLFQTSLYPFLDRFRPTGRLVVHIDCDLYSSALFCLAALNSWLVPGSIVIFDEFYDLENEFGAFRDWSRAFYKKCAGIAATPNFHQVALAVSDG
jgi:O-methyltransferase